MIYWPSADQWQFSHCSNQTLQSFLQWKSSDHTFKQRFTSTFTPAKRNFCLACKRNYIFIYWIFICLIYASPQTALKAKYLDWQPWKNWEHRDKKQMLILLLSTLKGRFILLKMPKKKTHDVVNKVQYIITRTGHHWCNIIILVLIVSKGRSSLRREMDDSSFCHFKTIQTAEFIAV